MTRQPLPIPVQPKVEIMSGVNKFKDQFILDTDFHTDWQLLAINTIPFIPILFFLSSSYSIHLSLGYKRADLSESSLEQ